MAEDGQFSCVTDVTRDEGRHLLELGHSYTCLSARGGATAVVYFIT